MHAWMYRLETLFIGGIRNGEGDEVPNNKWSPDQKSLPPVTQTIKNVPTMQVSFDMFVRGGEPCVCFHPVDLSPPGP